MQRARRKLSFDLALTATTSVCPQCQTLTRLIGIEPHATRKDIDVHTFHCGICGAYQTEVVRHSAAS